jgi:hypothetical protein
MAGFCADDVKLSEFVTRQDLLHLVARYKNQNIFKCCKSSSSLLQCCTIIFDWHELRKTQIDLEEIQLQISCLYVARHLSTKLHIKIRRVGRKITSINPFLSNHISNTYIIHSRWGVEDIWTKKRLMRGGWRKLHNEELPNLYSSPSIIKMIKPRRMRWVGHVARMGEKMNAYRTLVRKPEGKRPLGKTRHRWMDNINMDFREIGWDSVDWIDTTQDRDQWRALLNTVLNLRVP